MKGAMDEEKPVGRKKQGHKLESKKVHEVKLLLEARSSALKGELGVHVPRWSLLQFVPGQS